MLAPWCSLNSGRELAGLRDRGAAQAEAGGGGGEVAAAVDRLLGRDAVGAELVDLGAVAAVVHDRHQHADALAADGLELLDVHQQAAVALDQQHLAVALRRGDADGGGQRRADGAEVVDHVIALGRPALHVGHHHAEVMARADDDLPVLGDRLVELEHRLARVEGVGLHREFLGVGRVAGDLLGHLVGAEAGARHAALLHARHDRLGRGPGVGADVQVGGAQALPQAARVGVDLDGAGAGIEVAAFGRVVAERRTGADHQVGLGEALAREVAGEGAGDVERIGIAVEQALAEQRRRHQRARLGGQRFQCRAGAGQDGAAAGKDDRLLGLGDHVDDAVDDRGIGHRPLRHRHQLGGGCVVGEVRPGLLLQVHRHATAPPGAARAPPPGRPRARCRAGGPRASPPT